jgi:hypothetical protein
MVALLGQGVLDIDEPGGGSHRFYVAGGVIKVESDQVTVLTEYAGDAPVSEVPVGVVATPEDLLEHTSPGNPLACRDPLSG